MLKNIKLGTKISLGFALISSILLVLVLITILSIEQSNKLTKQVEELRIPTTMTSIEMVNGMNHSLAALRGWMILGKEKFKKERFIAWKDEIEPSIVKMQDLSKQWTNPKNIERFVQIKNYLNDFKIYQLDIENIAHSIDNQPALKILFIEAVPKADTLIDNITQIIDLEAKESSNLQRKKLLGIMADIRGSLVLELANIRAYLLSGDIKYKHLYNKYYLKNKNKTTQLHLSDKLLTKKQKKLFIQYHKLYKVFESLPQKMFSIRTSNDWNIANKFLEEKASPVAFKIKSILKKMISNQKMLMNEDIKSSKDFIYFLRILIWGSLAIGVLLSIAISLKVKKEIIKQIVKFEDGLFSFFKYLNKESTNITPLDDTIDDEFGQMAKVVNKNIDKTKKLLENHEEIFNQLEEYKKALDEHSIVAVTDTKGTITYVNDKFTKISGYSEPELLGQNHRLLNSQVHDVSLWKNMYKTLTKKETWNHKVCNKAKDGSLYWVDTTIIPILGGNNKVKSYIAIRTDITQRIKQEQELIKAKDEAQASSKSKSNFLATMSHEIRTPLNAIMGFIGLLKDDEEDKTKLEYLNTIDSSSKSLTNIINDILDFSKIESGKLDISYIDFNPEDEFKITQDLFKAKCEEKSLSLNVVFTNLPSALNGDALRIKQVVNNLLSNAIKFTPNGKSIFLNIEYKHKYLYISVKDEGIGISQENQEKVFESFTQADASTTREYGGTGLGLSISYNLVKLMDGKLKVQSQVGVGSEFYFSLPLKLGKNVKELAILNKDIDLSKLKVLLVEDNKANQMFMKITLKKLKIKFDIANDGLEAIESFKTNKYDAILMDENMPNMNGIKATAEIRRLEYKQGLEKTYIIALTANALKGDRERFLEAGMDNYLTKPLDYNLLVDALSSIYI